MIDFDRIKERKLVQWVLAYMAGAWVLLQVLDGLAGAFDWPSVVLRSAWILLGVGFFAALVLAWYHGEKGQQRVSGLELLMLSSLLVIGGGAVWLVSRGEIGPDGSHAAQPGAAPSSAVLASNAPVDRSIAVLPFVNMSSDPEQEYFSDGLTEELLNALARIPEMKVASRTSSFSFKDKNVPVDSVARALRVAHVLEGSVRKAGNRLRIMVQLVNARDGYQIWAEEFNRDLDDIFAIQEEISRSIAAALQAKLDANTSASLTADPKNIEAYNLYLQARFFWNQRTAAGLKRAQSLLERAVEVDPEFAKAHAALADVYYIVHEYSSTPQPELVRRIIRSAERAIELDSTLAEPYAALGGAYERRQRWSDAEAAYDRAIALDPRYATAHQWRAWLLAYLGRSDEALAGINRARVLEPLSLIINTNLGEHLLNLQRHNEARAQFQHVLTQDSLYAPALGLMAVVNSMRGDHYSAVQHAERLMGLAGVRSRYDLGRAAYAFANAGKEERAREILLDMERRGLWAFTAQGWLALGVQDRALEALEKAHRVQDPSLPRVITIDAATAPLFSHPQVRALRRSMSL